MLLEREMQVAALRRALDSAQRDGGRVVLIRGEAGSGKTALVEEFLRENGLDPAECVGYCDDLLTPAPLGPFWDIASVDPELHGALVDQDLIRVRHGVLRRLAQGSGAGVLVVEDTHWADEVTLDVILHVARRVRRTPGLVVLTFRDGELTEDHPLRQVIGDLPLDSVDHVHLEPLTLDAVTGLVAGTGLDAVEVLRQTGGNPLFVTEVVNAGLESVPPTVSDAVRGRVARMSARGRDIAELVAAAPGGLPMGLLDEIAPARVGVLDDAARAGLLVVSPDRVAFRHELQRRAVESSLPPHRRAELNRRLLDALGDAADPAVAVHFARAAHDDDALRYWGPRAVRSAHGIGAHREAVAHARVLEPELPSLDPQERADVLEDWAISAFMLESGDEIPLLRRAIRERRLVGPDERVGHLLAFAVRAFEVRGHPEEARLSLDDAMSTVRSTSSRALRLHVLALRAWLAMMRGEGVEALGAADLVLRDCAEPEDAPWRVHALNSKGTVLAMRGEPAGFDLLEESARLAADNRLRHEQLRALHNLADGLAGNGEFARAHDAATRELQEARRHDLPRFEAAAASLLVRTALAADSWDDVFDLAHEHLGASADLDIGTGATLGRVHSRRGDSAADGILRRSWEAASTHFADQHRLEAAGPLAEHLWLRDIDDPALVRQLRHVAESPTEPQPWRLGDLILWLHLLGVQVAPGGAIPEPHRLFLAGDHAGAARAWSAAGHAYEAHLARAQLGGAEAVEALRYFDDLGARPMSDKVRAQLRREGVRATRGRARSTRRDATGLTARQREILRLLAEGLSNREIADRLFLSVRTVENHVAATLAKLGAEDRAQAVAEARRRGQLETNP